MLSSLKTKDDLIFAYAEWYVLNEKTQFSEQGKYIWIHEIWIHPAFKDSGRTLKKLIHEIHIHPKSQTGQFCYWRNLKHNERITKLLSRNRLAKLGENHGI